MEKKEERVLFIISICITIYLTFLVLNAEIFHIENVVLGIILESVTIPIILLQIILLVVVIKKIIVVKQVNFKSQLFWSLVLLILSNTIVIGSFIFST